MSGELVVAVVFLVRPEKDDGASRRLLGPSLSQELIPLMHLIREFSDVDFIQESYWTP